jgi:hypothetical protein
MRSALFWDITCVVVLQSQSIKLATSELNRRHGRSRKWSDIFQEKPNTPREIQLSPSTPTSLVNSENKPVVSHSYTSCESKVTGMDHWYKWRLLGSKSVLSLSNKFPLESTHRTNRLSHCCRHPCYSHFIIIASTGCKLLNILPFKLIFIYILILLWS